MVGIVAWFCEAIVESGPSKNFAAYRSTETTKELLDLASNNPQVLIPILAESTLEEDVSNVSKMVSQETNKFDLVINFVGYLHNAEHGPEKNLR